MEIKGKSVLFITTRNINQQSGALSLIRNRALAMRSEFKVDTTFVALSNQMYGDQKCRLSGDGFDVSRILINKKNVLSIVIGYLRLLKLVSRNLRKSTYDNVVFSGFFPVLFLYLLRLTAKRNLFIYDSHGATEESIEYPGKNWILSRLKYIIFTTNLVFCYKIYDGAFVVSQAMVNYVRDKYRPKDTFDFFIVPCTGLGKKSYQSEIQDSRKFLTDQYNIKDDALVFIYAGGSSPWQCIDETLGLFNKIVSIYGNKCHLIMLMSDKDYVLDSFYSSLPITITSVEPEHVKNYVMASDFAFLLRFKDFTNLVAFPNKFYEYVCGHTLVISTGAIRDVAKYINNFDVGVVLDSPKDYSKLLGYIQDYEVAQTPKESQFNALIDSISFRRTLENYISKL